MLEGDEDANPRNVFLYYYTGELRAVREGNRDEMIVSVATPAPESEHAAIREELEALLKEKIGVKFGVEVVGPGRLDDWTEIKTSPKPKRFRDERG